MTDAAATYTRSSKDRSDGASIADQDRVNMRVAREQRLPVVAKYSDVVESAKDPFRPDFQRLLADMKKQSREWNTLIIYDTSRLFRGQYFAQAFKHDAQRLGVRVIFATIPEGLDEVSRMMLESQFQVMDEVHSIMSKQKGLAAMAENVRAGYRAGGRAPRGYDLRHIRTGAIRDGRHVLKSHLVPNGDAVLVARYLQLRIKGVGRASAIRQLKLPWPESSLVDLEWNALTYAGCTVWNMRNEFKKKNGYSGGRKRRPRKDWLVKEDTHHALISIDEACRLIDALENSTRSGNRQSSARHLLVGLLQTPAGFPWYGNGGTHYRTAKEAPVGRYIRAEAIDRPVLQQIVADMQSPRFVRELLKASRKMNQAVPVPGDDIRKREAEISKRISGLLHIADQLQDPSPAYREIEKLEEQRKDYARQISAIQGEYEAAEAINRLTEPKILQLLRRLAMEIEAVDRETLKGLLGRLCERILLDPESMQCQIHYRIRADHRNSMASPRGFEPLLPP